MDNLNEPKFQTGNETEAGSQADLAVNNSVSSKTPVRLVTLVVLSVFLSEILVMLMLPLLPAIPVWGEALLDAAMLVILASPALYFGLFRSLIQQLDQRLKLLKELEKHTLRLEKLVAERTSDLSIANEMLSRKIKERESAEKELLLKTGQLGQRVKELNCLYSISSLLVSPDLTLAEMLQSAVDLIPAGLQFPDITCARIQIENQEVKTANYSETGWKLTGSINFAGERSGRIEIGYLQEKPKLDEGPFLKEERNLINAIAEQLKNAVSQKKIEDDLREALRDSRRRRDEVSALLESLQDSEERFRSVVETANEGIILVNSTGIIQFWNNGAEKMFGYSTEEMSGKNLNFIIPKRFQNAHQNALKDVVTTWKSKLSGQTLNLTGTRKDGTGFPLELTLATWKTKDQLFFTAVIRDVTKRKQAEEALNRLNLELEERVKERTAELHMEIDERKAAEQQIRKSRAMLQAVFDGIFDPLILVDKNMRIKMLNKMAAEYYRISDYPKAVGQICHEAKGKSDLCSDCQIPAAASKGQFVSFERQSFSNPGAIEQVFVYPVDESDGDIGGAIIRITDITEAKRFERRLIQSEKMASLGILVSSIAHEINNPNNFVSFNIPILREYTYEIIPYLDKYVEKDPNLEICNMPYPEFRRDIFKLLDNIENGSRRISTFISNLREYSQGGSIRAFTWLDRAVLIDKVLDIIQAEIKKTVKIFNKSICTDLPEIYSDPHAIEQILINLLINASQALSRESSRVDLTVMPSNGKEEIVIEVADNGCGMDQKTQLKIFDPFFTTKPAAQGTGLGLYVCHNLIKGLGGRIEVESELGKGSTFRVFIPGKATPKMEKN